MAGSIGYTPPGDPGAGNASNDDADLVAIAALDSTQPGVIASNGAGWLRKTYAQLKTALGLDDAQVKALATAAAPIDWGGVAGIATWQDLYDQGETWTSVSGLTWGELGGFHTWQRAYNSGRTWNDVRNMRWSDL